MSTDRAGRHLTWGRQPHFTERVAQSQNEISVAASSKWLASIGNRIRVELYAQHPLEREHRHIALTEAWFDDLAALPSHLSSCSTHTELATTEMKEWISGPFLAHVAQVSTVRVVIAGQEVPEARNIEWGHCSPGAYPLWCPRGAALATRGAGDGVLHPCR